MRVKFELLSLIVIFLAITISQVSSGNTTCSPGCMSCEEGICTTCFRRDTKNKQCQGSFAPPSEHCEIYEREEPGCTWCKKGYASDVFGTGECVPSKLSEECQVAFDMGGHDACFICDGGFPNFSHQHCSPFSGEKHSVNCLWGGRDDYGIFCQRCKTGYTSMNGTCKPSVINGCLASNFSSNRCDICNSWEGWFQVNDNGTCEKAGKSQQKQRTRKTLFTSFAAIRELKKGASSQEE